MTEFDPSNRSGHAASDIGGSNRNHREDTNRARQAAEALFAPKQRVAQSPAGVPVPAADQTTRKPRILSAVSEKPARIEPGARAAKIASSNEREKIPGAHFARIRTWLKYGMSITQVAELYGVPIGEIETMMENA